MALVLPKSLDRDQRESAEREARELSEIVGDIAPVADRVGQLVDRWGASVNGLKLEDIQDVLDSWLGETEELISDLWRTARGLPC